MFTQKLLKAKRYSSYRNNFKVFNHFSVFKSTSSNDDLTKEIVEEDTKTVHNGPIDKLLRKLKWTPDDLIRDDNFNRYLMFPAATLNHLCLGSIFAWSVFNQPLMRAQGVLAASSSDWLLSDVTVTFSLVMGGMAWGAIFSKYLDRFGPRACSMIGSVSLFSGFGLAALAVNLHSLPVLYLGGLVWGFANGWSYIPPVACLLKWFPERKGLASGMCLVGYGGGAMIAAPLFSKLLDIYKKAPEFLGSLDSVKTFTKDGKLYSDITGTLYEVVVATKRDISVAGFEGICDPGVYIVGSGQTGVIETFAILGLGYSAIMATCAMAFRLPKTNYLPPNFSPTLTETTTDSTKQNHLITTHNVETNVAIRTPQFWLLYAGFAAHITGAYGLLSCGKILLTESFSSVPVVTNAFTTTFVAGLSAANLSGRLFYTQLSDMLASKSKTDPFFARRKAFNVIFTAAIPSYLAIVWSIHQDGTTLLPLIVFCTSAGLVLSSFGGSAATRPPIIADLFAPLSAIQLSGVLPAAYLGPKIVTTFRESETKKALVELSSKVDDVKFESVFGASKENIDALVEQKTLTITRLMELVPQGTIDPSPYVYDSSMYLMAGLQVVALGVNFLIKPVPDHLHSNQVQK